MPGTKEIVRHGSCDQRMFDSGQNINWKTEEKAKVQDCVYYFCEQVRNSSSHKPLRTFSQWFQSNRLACFLHLITFVI